jgi:hypothetical protein
MLSIFTVPCPRSDTHPNLQVPPASAPASTSTFARHRQIQVARQHLLGQQNDLPRMLPKMRRHLEDRLQHGRMPHHARWLRVNHLQQPLMRHRHDHGTRLFERALKALTRRTCLNHRLQRKLRIPHTHIRLSRNPMHDPLPHVAFQMQQEVRDRVLILPAAPPHLLLAQLIATARNVRARLARAPRTDIQKRARYIVVHGPSLPRPAAPLPISFVLLEIS